MVAPSAILELVSRFQEHIDSYRSGHYNETQLRREFIDPMFGALGWDITNLAGYAELYKDVIHEDALKIGATIKAPDYGFRIGGTRKFFLEAKRPHVSIRNESGAAYQLRRYAWSAKLPLSILTNFAEFAVYDCRVKPEREDKASVARVQYLTFGEYPEKWDDIAGIFSRESILRGAFDKFATTTKLKRGTAEVDDAFLTEIEQWREQLARNFALRNSNLGVRELNGAVQRTIDRIIFLRIAEDRGIEPYARLRSATSGTNVYANLANIFRQADSRYNSGLFHFEHDESALDESIDAFSLSLNADDSVLKEIIQSLYYPESPYEFSVLPADILGQIYEQFLGKVIRLVGRRAIVEEKPEIKKAGGVYYTPSYIVDYIIRQTISPLLQGKEPAEISGESKHGKQGPLTILDPACGSGSFLIAAYQLLLDFYHSEYLKAGAERYARGREPKLYQVGNGEWRLTIAERRRILLTHIFGVDIDPQAVEVTKLSLLLKVLEGESRDAIARQMDLFHMRALPDLATNIKCGNSIVGSDFYESQPNLLADAEVVERINAFNWNKEFHKILSGTRFSAVIGNPPYRRELDYKHLMDEIASTDFGRRYRSARMDLWYYFVHRSLDLLSKSGRLGFIVNAYWTSGTGADKLIERIKGENLLEEIFYFGSLNVFRKVSGNHMILLLRRDRPTSAIKIRHCEAQSNQKTAEPCVRGWSATKDVLKPIANVFVNGKVDIELDIFHEHASPTAFATLEQYAIVRQGIAENPSTINRKVRRKYGAKYEVGEGVFVVSDEELAAMHLNATEKGLIKRYHDLRDIDRYWVSESPKSSIIYSTKVTAPGEDKIPNLIAHLKKFRPIMEARRETMKGSNRWWHLHWPREENIWKADKIIALQMAKRPSFALAKGETYSTFSTNVIIPKQQGQEFILALLGLLNSQQVSNWLKHHAKRRGVALEINGNVLRKIPVPKEMGQSSARRKDLATLVAARIKADGDLRRAETDHSRSGLTRQIDSLEGQIDQRISEWFEN